MITNRIVLDFTVTITTNSKHQPLRHSIIYCNYYCTNDMKFFTTKIRTINQFIDFWLDTVPKSCLCQIHNMMYTFLFD